MRLRKVLSLVFLCLMVPSFGRTDGMMFVDAETAKAQTKRLINETEQKAVIFFDKGEEQLIISPSYDGAPEKFAWVVPVPTRPKVEIADASIFEELVRMNRVQGLEIARSSIKSSAPPEEPPVKVIERKTVGKYDVSVLSAADGNALMDWLTANGYHVPREALEPIQDYVKRKWTFVASKVIDSEPGTVEGLRSGTLAPLKLTFHTARPVYPMKLSSANPAPFDLLIYIIIPTRSDNSKDYEYTSRYNNYRVKLQEYPLDVFQPNAPCSYDGYASSILNKSRRESYPALAKLSQKTLLVFQAARPYPNSKIEPGRCKMDLVWNVFYHPAK